MPSQNDQYELFEFAPEATAALQSPPWAQKNRFGDWIVYVDESGDHSLVNVDSKYPVFVLAFCVFNKRHYSEKIIPAVEKFKFNYFGHDSVVLHENEIRKQKGAFAFLSHRALRERFVDQLSAIMNASNFVLIACVVDKRKLSKAESSSNPYDIALGLCVSSLRSFLAEKQQDQRQTHVIVECRGQKEDRELELEFRRICDDTALGQTSFPLDIVFAEKKTNLAGLQLADLVARPVGLNHIKPDQANRAFEVLKTKFYCAGGRTTVGHNFEQHGLLIHPPQKAKSPGEPTEA